ncbi:MAG: DNA-directed RNA polymerase subunit delta [Bacillus sp. (in: Bacteria)]|nr:DNA-directed RNA polymerase subunit delta [Bacillus sp. (in: firmicutes)]
MSIKQYNESQLKEMAMLEIAYEILEEAKSPGDYHSLLKDVAEMKGLSEQQVKDRIAHLYTEMSMDGRFVNIGENRWGLRSWYEFDKTEEELSQANKTRKKKRSEEEEEDQDYFDDEEEDFDEFEDLEDELDEIANEEDEDFEDDDEDLEDEGFDDELEEESDDEELL